MLTDSSSSSPQRSSDYEIQIFSTWIGSWRVSIGRRAYSKKELVDYYDNVSEDWNARLGRLGSDIAYKQLLSEVLQQDRYAIPTGSLCVLDAGIGTGAFSSAFLDLKPDGCVLCGIDLSERMLRQAEQNLRDRNVDLSLKQADVRELPFRDAAFDIVLAAHVIEHMECPRAALMELYRVLKPGGLLITCITKNSPAGAIVQLLWRTHRLERVQALLWMRETGLRSVRSVPFNKRSIMRKLSIGYVGQKPKAGTASSSD